MIGAVIDTDVFSILIGHRPQAKRFRALVDGMDTALAFPSIAELLYGAHLARWGPVRLEWLESEIAQQGLLMPTHELLRLFGELRATAAGIGHPLGQPVHANDLWIASCAVHYGVPLVTGNGRHFAGLPELEVLG